MGSSLLFKNAMVQESVTRRSAEALSEVTLMGMSAAVTRLIAADAADCCRYCLTVVVLE